MPCVHMCNIIGDKDYLLLSSFHLKWWKQFSYFHKKDYAKSLVSQSLTVMEKALADQRKNSLLDSTFSGIHFDDKSPFVMSVKSPAYTGTYYKNDIFIICSTIMEYNMNNCATSYYHYNCTKVQ